MKKHFLAAIVIAAAAAGTAHAQNYSAPINGKPRAHIDRRPALSPRGEAAGAIPRGARGGNPAQMLNPRAPRKYFGAPQETVTYDPDNPSKITGIILIGVSW